MILLLVGILAIVAGMVLARRRTARTAPIAWSARFDGPSVGGRLLPMLAGIAAVALLALVVFGFESASGLTGLVLVAVLVAAGAMVMRGRREPAAAEGSWSAPARAGHRAGPRSCASEVPARSVARALGRVELRELFSSPWFGVGIGFCVVIYVMFGFVFAEGNSETWNEYIQLAPWFAHPLVGMAVLAGHRAVTRARRDGTEELLDSCPTVETTRTAGFLRAAVAPIVVIVVFVAVLFGTSFVRSPYLHGPLGADSVADLLATAVLGAGGVVLGVAIGRWVHFALAPVVAIVAIGLATTTINGVGGHGWNPLVPLSTAPTVEGSSPVFVDRPALWHLLWIIGLTAVVGVVAVARHRRDLAVAVAAAITVVVVVAAGIGATRPMAPASAARIADLIAHPEAHQDCAATSGPVEVCVYRAHRSLLGRVTARVTPVAAVLPSDVGPLTLRQTFDGVLDDLPPEVRRHLTEADLVRAAPEVPIGFGEDLLEFVGDPGFRVALAALDLPVVPSADLVPVVLAGQARGVVALWLATRGLDADDAARATTSAAPESPDPFDRGSLAKDVCAVPAAVWSAQDLAAARAVSTQPEADVASVIADGWARWRDPQTGTDELLVALGLPAVGPFDAVVARAGQPC